MSRCSTPFECRYSSPRIMHAMINSTVDQPKLITGLMLCEILSVLHMISEVAPVEKIEHYVQVILILKGVVHVDEERIAELREKTLLVHDGADGTLEDYAGLRHLFHGQLHPVAPLLHLPYLPVPALPDRVEILEVAAGQLYYDRRLGLLVLRSCRSVDKVQTPIALYFYF